MDSGNLRVNKGDEIGWVTNSSTSIKPSTIE